MRACFCGGQVLPLGGRGGGWEGSRVWHHPQLPPPHASALAAPHRVGLCLLGSCMQQNWRGLILVGVLFSSEKEQVKVKLQLT